MTSPRASSSQPVDLSPEPEKYKHYDKHSDSDPLFLDDDDASSQSPGSASSVPLEYDNEEGTTLIGLESDDDVFNDAFYPPPLRLDDIEIDNNGMTNLHRVYRLDTLLSDISVGLGASENDRKRKSKGNSMKRSKLKRLFQAAFTNLKRKPKDHKKKE